MKHIILVVAFFSCMSLMHGQEVLRSTLGVAGSSEVVVDGDEEYTIQQSVGQQSVIGSFSSETVTLRQGFIQPPVKIQRIYRDESNLDAVVYPNPFESSINIRFNEELEGTISVLIYDLLGRVVYENGLGADREISINLDMLSSAEYILLVSANNKTFKANILKN
ncbi:MAG: T9SS type A sorting domain-containing protein [Bacteroidota bacterium]